MRKERKGEERKARARRKGVLEKNLQHFYVPLLPTSAGIPIGTAEKRSNGQAIPETCASQRYFRTSFYLRRPGRPTIYAGKQQHISTAEKKSKETI